MIALGMAMDMMFHLSRGSYEQDVDFSRNAGL